ncbi:MAG TPA: ribonuclease [Noviherbaspirillum sp.]|uniref:ribonuclease n=1 Tax=Noviherbaspirillum sp. TaxID=1926288 RepID=UPI002D3FD5D0|nr:ribonuclease [Noviherbaspirillum sp.]HYD94050.1 ribonuclease [Noviherbaspirillum sp.]
MIAKLLKSWTFFVLAFFLSASVMAREGDGLGVVPVDRLPREAQQTLALIKQGGPFPYRKDGSVFRNYEGVLPKQKRGYYHEFTVPTPGARNRGARRIVAGGDPRTSGEYYYTEDHYATFRRIKE